MKIIKLNSTWNKLKNSVRSISKSRNKVRWSKEEILISRIGQELGKSKQEVCKLVSKDLLSLLSMVPFSK